MLPMILGAGLAAATGGSSLLIGAGIGGLQAARTGSIGKGLMAGLGAFGGAGLASGLAAAGATNMAGGLAGASPAELAAAKAGAAASPLSAISSGVTGLGTEAGRSAALSALGGGMGAAQTIGAATAPSLIKEPTTPTAPTPDKDMGQRYAFTGTKFEPQPAPDVPTYEDMLTKQGNFGRQQNYFASPTYTPVNPSEAKEIYHFAEGGNPIERMSNQNAIGANTGFPQAYMHSSQFAVPTQTPVSQNVLTGSGDTGVDPYTGEEKSEGEGISKFGTGGNVELHGHFSADGGQDNSGGGFGGQGANGYQAVGSGGGYNSSLGVNGNAQGNGPSPSYQQFQQGDTFQGTRAFGGNPQQSMQNMFAMLSGHPMGNYYAPPSSPNAPAAPNSVAEETPIPGTPGYNAPPAMMATGGISDAHYNLGGYSDGGRLLRGPGDGVSDSIPATIGHKQPARLADGEFVVPARIVSELGNGSTEAGARKLYAMMDRVQAARKNTIGKGKVAHNSRADKYLPA
jgi:hypothetical protein